MLQNHNTGFDVVIAASEAIAADAYFNRWVATTAKSKGSKIDMLELVERYGDLVDECTSAWARFLADEKSDQLLSSIRHVSAKVTRLMSG